MKRTSPIFTGLATGISLAIGIAAIAGPITTPNTFTAGTPARAAEVNANFSAVASAVNDNDARIGALEAAAQETDVAPGGNLVLAPSTATNGNVLKGPDAFIHDYGVMNTFVGLGAGNFTLTAQQNSGLGFGALANVSSGNDNTASGGYALAANTTGAFNTAVGANALRFNTVGSGNTAQGVSALRQSTTGVDNTGVGVRALVANATGDYNTGVGSNALAANTSGARNTAVGVSALSATLLGTDNLALGFNAGRTLTSGSNNILIAHMGAVSESNTTRIGSGQTRAFMAGVRGVSTGIMDAVPVVIDSNGQLGTVNSSRRLKDHIVDMGDASSSLMQLRPVTFYYKSDKNPEGRTLQFGLIAEEVAKVAPELVARSPTGGVETVYYGFLTPMLLNEYQRQQRALEAQTARVAMVERELVALRRHTERVVAALERFEQPTNPVRAAR